MAIRTLVYVAGPITKGDVEQNVRAACEASKLLIQAGLAPFTPQLSAYFDGPTAIASPSGIGHEEWLAVDFAWLACADALLRLPGESKGADAEVDFAKKVGIQVFYAVDQIIAWEKHKCRKPLTDAA